MIQNVECKPQRLVATTIYVSNVVVTPIVDKVPQYVFDGAVQKISHMISRNDYGEGHIWIMPPTCTVAIEEVYIRTVGRAIFAILYAPVGTVNMQRLVDQFAPRWTPHSGTLEVHQNEVTECQERGEGAIPARPYGDWCSGDDQRGIWTGWGTPRMWGTYIQYLTQCFIICWHDANLSRTE